MNREEIDKRVKLEKEAEIAGFASETIVAIDKVLFRLNSRIRAVEKDRDEVYKHAEEENINELRALSITYRDPERI